MPELRPTDAEFDWIEEHLVHSSDGTPIRVEP